MRIGTKTEVEFGEKEVEWDLHPNPLQLQTQEIQVHPLKILPIIPLHLSKEELYHISRYFL